MSKFAKGQSGNPNGRPKAITLDELRNIARRSAPAMVKVLIDIAEDVEQPAAARAAAANHVMDRAYGKPPQSLADENGDTLSWTEFLTGARLRAQADEQTVQ